MRGEAARTGIALAFGWIGLGEPGTSTLVVKRNDRVVWRADLDRMDAWRFREGFVPIPPGEMNFVHFEVEGPARVGIVNPDFVEAEVISR